MQWRLWVVVALAHAWTGRERLGAACERALLFAVSSPLAARGSSARACVWVRAQGGAMDELGEPVFSDERTLAEEILQSAAYFSESIWPAGFPPDDAEERRAVVASCVARIRGGPTSTPPARRFEVACCDSLAAYVSLTDEAAASMTGMPPLLNGSLTEEETCAVMAALAGRLPALRSLNVTGAQLRALVPVWREMAAAGRPAGLIHLVVQGRHVDPWGAPAAPELALPPLGDLLPRLQSLDLSVDVPEHVASWCAMLAGEGAPALAALTLPAPSSDALPDEQAAMYVDVLRRQAGSLRKLTIQPYRMSAGAAEALEAAIVALPHLVNLSTGGVQVEGSVRVLGGRASRLRKVNVSCEDDVDPAACLTAWARELAPSVEFAVITACPRISEPAAPAWGELAAALRALGTRSALRSLSLSAGGVRDGVPWMQSVLSPPPDLAAATVWPHLQELEFDVLLRGRVTADVELDLRHFPRLRKISSSLLREAAIAGVMRSAACRDVQLLGAPVLLTAADDAAFAPKERLLAELSDDTAEDTLATLASVVGGWPGLCELRLYAPSNTGAAVSEATQVALVRVLGRCTRLREIVFPFPLCPAAAATLAEALPRLPEVTRIEVGDVTTSSLLALVHGLLGTGRHAGNAARTLRAVVSGTGDPATTTDDLRELGSAVAAAGQRGWAAVMKSNRYETRTPLDLLSQVQALALRRDWRDCIVPLSTIDVTPGECTLLPQPCGLVVWDRCE
jgi:hypothetical protein